MSMEGLGKDYDLAMGVVPIDLCAAQYVGDAINLRNADGVDVVLLAAAGTQHDDPVLTFEQAQGIAGVYKALLVDHYYRREATLLASGAAWERVANGVAGTGITTVTGSGTSAEKQEIWVIPIEASQLDVANGYDCIRVTCEDPGAAGTKYGCMFYHLRNLHTQRKPANLPSPLV